MIRVFLILAVIVTSTWATDYLLLPEDADLYVPCTDGPPGSVNLPEAFDMRNIKIDQDGEDIHLTGNCTSVWSVPPTDRIDARITVMRFDRGTWQPTVLNIHTSNLCSVMFDKNQYWYKFWFKSFSNREEMREKCIGTKGTVLTYNNFTVKPRLNNVIGPTLHGRYKAVITFEPFDENNIKRPLSVCFEVRGYIEKIK
ncbi:uncharacterized protein LOC108048181 [Drosophila rhopaloa]|uniref:Uncharacterized protein LOC108048181 n=1 Tax=Drosophila rhopaloa TaxID=1041015 RepID=A0A6P4FA32_DRORH|nr:uncharacterized protein LOC108048181 [Drosophila rhopaloa]